MSQHLARGEQQLQRVADTIRKLNPKRVWRIEFAQYQERRSVSQNKLYWAVITEMASETGHTKDEMHDAMKTKFLPQEIIKLAGEDVYIPASSAKLQKDAFSEYVEKVIAFAVSELGIVV